MTDSAWRGDPEDPRRPGPREPRPGAPDGPGQAGYWNDGRPEDPYRNDPYQNDPYQNGSYQPGAPYRNGAPADGGYGGGGYQQSPDYPPATDPGYAQGYGPGPATGPYQPVGPGPATGQYQPGGLGGTAGPYPAGDPDPYPPSGPGAASGPHAPGAPGGAGATRQAGTSVRGALVPRAGTTRTPPRPPGAAASGPRPTVARAGGAVPGSGVPRSDLYRGDPARPAGDGRAESAAPYSELGSRFGTDVPSRDPAAEELASRDLLGPGTGPRSARGRRSVAGRDGTGPVDRPRPGGDEIGAGGAEPRRTASRRPTFDEPDFPDERYDDLDSPAEDETGDTGLGPFLRRLVIALVVLAAALAVGVGAGAVWEKVRPSGDTASAGETPPAASPTPSGAPASAAPSAGAPAGGAQAQVAVPADWTAHTDTEQKATFSHPPVWKLRRDNTGVFFGEPGAGAVGTSAEYGPHMIGVARVAGADAATALTQVQNEEFGSVSGLTRDRSGPATDTTGAPTQELAGSYDRDGQRVSYVMRTVETSGSVHVLIARVPTDASATLNTLMGALRASFQPIA